MKDSEESHFGVLGNVILCAISMAAYQAKAESVQQIGALFLLIVAPVLLSTGEGSTKGSSSDNPNQILFYGIIHIIVAQYSLVRKHSSYLMTIEISRLRLMLLVAFLLAYSQAMPVVSGSSIFKGKPPSHDCLVALLLVVGSIAIHQKYPYRVKKKEP
ncbi:hypothetical protein MLD38_031304 [Melastoma candidum]|uniref:Uncharacterized protein n=1 Tax=Melastoma candidum TaxID=119954 RepID=A0ACB9MNW7_9MYRT|nr:hypothetical protein MLD38_031304 [Melastoma candidum]